MNDKHFCGASVEYLRLVMQAKKDPSLSFRLLNYIFNAESLFLYEECATQGIFPRNAEVAAFLGAKTLQKLDEVRKEMHEIEENETKAEKLFGCIKTLTEYAAKLHLEKEFADSGKLLKIFPEFDISQQISYFLCIARLALMNNELSKYSQNVLLASRLTKYVSSWDVKTVVNIYLAVHCLLEKTPKKGMELLNTSIPSYSENNFLTSEEAILLFIVQGIKACQPKEFVKENINSSIIQSAITSFPYIGDIFAGFSELREVYFDEQTHLFLEHMQKTNVVLYIFPKLCSQIYEQFILFSFRQIFEIYQTVCFDTLTKYYKIPEEEIIGKIAHHIQERNIRLCIDYEQKFIHRSDRREEELENFFSANDAFLNYINTLSKKHVSF